MDLFPETSSEVISAPGASLVLHRAVALGSASDELLGELLRDTPWRSGDVVLFGKRYRQPRLFAWYGDPGASYRYSGTTLEPLPWTARLDDLRRRMERLAGAPFNSVLLNYYRDQQDAMGLHADDEPELGDRPVIASLSLGEARPFRLRHRHDKAIKALKLPLPPGSVLVMAGDTQANWKHEIPRQARPCGPRVNLTFRYIYPVDPLR
jgi:alkylated DNA repair dioxygenase AlkB